MVGRTKKQKQREKPVMVCRICSQEKLARARVVATVMVGRGLEGSQEWTSEILGFTLS